MRIEVGQTNESTQEGSPFQPTSDYECSIAHTKPALHRGIMLDSAYITASPLHTSETAVFRKDSLRYA